jgi:hypothetical protein
VGKRDFGFGGQGNADLRDTVSALSRVAVLWPPHNRGIALNFQQTEDGAKALGLEVPSVEVHTPEDLGVSLNGAGTDDSAGQVSE